MLDVIIIMGIAVLGLIIGGIYNLYTGKKQEAKLKDPTCSNVKSNVRFLMSMGKTLLWTALGVAVFVTFWVIGQTQGWLV